MARSDTDTWTDTWQEHWSDDSGSGPDDGDGDGHDEYSAEYNDVFHAQGPSYHPQQFVGREDNLGGGERGNGNGSGNSSSLRRQQPHPLDMRPPSGRSMPPRRNGTDDSVSSESSGDVEGGRRGQRRWLLGRASRRSSPQQPQQDPPKQRSRRSLDSDILSGVRSFDVNHHHHSPPPEHDHDLRGYRRHRADAWLYLLVTSGIAVGSLVRARASDAIPSFVVTESAAYVTGVALTSVTLAAAAVMAVGYRLPWFRRNALRQGMPRRRQDGGSGGVVDVSPEMAVAVVVLALHLAAMSVLLNGSNYLATRGTMIANSNLFYATWTSFGLLVFLVSNILSTCCSDDCNSYNSYNSYNHGNPSRIYLTTLWLSHLHLSAATLATSLALRYRTPLCRGLLSSSPVCDSPLATLVSSALSLGLTLLALLVARSETRQHLPPSSARRIHTVVAGTASMLDAIGTIYVTSPGGMGFVSGNLFWVSWATTGAALALWVGYLNGACAAPMAATKNGSFSFPAKDAMTADPNATNVHLLRIRAPGSDSSRATEPTDTEDESSNEERRLPRRSRQNHSNSNSNSNSNSHPALPEGVLPPPPNMVASEHAAAPDARGLHGHLFGAGASVRASDRLPSPSDVHRPDAEGTTARDSHIYHHPPYDQYPYDHVAYTGESRSARDPDAGYDASGSGSAFSSDPTPPPPPPVVPREEDDTETETEPEFESSERRSSRRRPRTGPSPVGNASAATRSRSTRSSSTNSNSRATSKNSKTKKKKKRKDKAHGGDQPQQQQQQQQPAQSVFNSQPQYQQQQPQYPPPPPLHPPQPQTSQQPFPYHQPVTGSFTTYQGHGQSSYVSFPSFNSAPVNPPADSVSSRSDGIVSGVGTSTTSSSGRTPRTVDESDRDDDDHDDDYIDHPDREDKSSLSTPRTETDRSGPLHAQHDHGRSASKSPGRPSVNTTANTTRSRKSSSRSRSSSRNGASGAGERRSVTPSKSTAGSSKASSRSPGNYRANANRYGNDDHQAHPRHPYTQSPSQNPYPHNLPPPPPPPPPINPLYPMPSVTTVNPSDSDTTISDPTIDHSIMTSKQKGVEREKQVNHAVAAALAHAEAFKKTTAASSSKKSSSKSGSGSGRKNGSKNGTTTTTTVDEIVAAAIAAATFKTGGGTTAKTNGSSRSGNGGGGGKRRNRGSGSGGGGVSPAMMQHPYVVPPPLKHPPVDDTSAENAERSSIHSFYSESKHSKGSGSNHSLSTNSAFDC